MYDITIRTKYLIGATVYWTDINNTNPEIKSGLITNIHIYNKNRTWVWAYEIDRSPVWFLESELSDSHLEALEQWNSKRRGVIN